MGGLRTSYVGGAIAIIGARAVCDLAPVIETQGFEVRRHDSADSAVADRQLAQARLVLVGADDSGLHPVTACWRIRAAGYDGLTFAALPHGDKTPATELARFGVDDFVVLPAPVDSVVDRVRVALASGATRWLPGIKLGALELDCRTQSARVEGIPVQLPPSSFAVLADVVVHGGEGRRWVQLSRANGVSARHAKHLIHEQRAGLGIHATLIELIGCGCRTNRGVEVIRFAIPIERVQGEGNSEIHAIATPRSILIIDGDSERASRLEQLLRRAGVEVVECCEIDGALERLRFAHAEIALVDCSSAASSHLRALRSALPALFIVGTASNASVDERIAAVDCGADVCLEQPVCPNEVFALWKAGKRRRVAMDLAHTAQAAADAFQLVKRDDVEVAIVCGRPVSFTDTELEILRGPFECRGKYVSREHIQVRVWGRATESTARTLEVHLTRIARKLGRNAWLLDRRRRRGVRLLSDRRRVSGNAVVIPYAPSVRKVVVHDGAPVQPRNVHQSATKPGAERR